MNSDIRDTLIAEATEDFWWLNNGITLLADDATLATNKGLVLTNPTVVNGLQTSNEVFRYFKENPQKIESEARNILVRVIRPESEEIRDRIILATNNQTSIPKASLRVNDPIHWQIELYFKGKGLYYDRRKNYYKNQGIKGSQIVSVSFLAQCMISLLLQMPDFARARPSTLLTKDDTYEKLYVENQDLDVFYNAACLGRAIDSTLKRASNITIAQKNDIQFFVLYYAVAKKTQKVVLEVNDIKNIAMEDYTEEYILQIAEKVLAEYNALGGNGQVAKSGRFTERLKELLSS